MAYESEAKQYFVNLDLDFQERYDMARFLRFDGDVFDPLSSHLYSQIKKLKSGGVYTSTGEDYRPDSVSNKIYGTTQYWWVLLIYNDKMSFNDLQHGDEIQYPSVQALEDLYYKLKINQNKVDKD